MELARTAGFLRFIVIWWAASIPTTYWLAYKVAGRNPIPWILGAVLTAWFAPAVLCIVGESPEKRRELGLE